MFGLGKNKKSSARGFAAVSIQPDGVAVACVDRSQDPPQLRLCRHYPVSAPTTLDEVLRTVAGERALADYPVSTVLGAEDFSLLLLEKPPVADEELRGAVQWKIRDLIDFPVEEAVIDVLAIPGGRSEMVYVVAARQDVVRAQIQRLEQAGFALEVVDIPEMAQRNLAGLLPEDEGGVAMLSLRGGDGLFTITRGGTLYLSRRLDTGLDALLPGEGFEVSPGHEGGDEGEVLSLDVVSAEQQQLLDGVVLEIQRSLDYYESHFGQPPVGTVVLGPTARSVTGLQDYLAANLAARVRGLDLAEVLEVPAEVDRTQQGRCLIAIGAALRVGGDAGDGS